MKDRVIGELNRVFYPGKTHSIVKEGVLEDVEVEGSKVIVKLKLKHEENDSVIELLKKSIPMAVKKIDGVEDVELVIEKVVDESKKLSKIKHVIATTSGKGGVGKSTVSVNTALALAKFGYKVGLLDADIYGPNIPTMMGIEGVPVTIDPKYKDKILPIEKYGIKILSIGNLVPKDAAVIWRGALIHQAIKQFLDDVVWGDLDFLVVDLPPGTGDAQLSLAQLTKVSGGIIVITPQNVAMSDAMRAHDFFKRLNIPTIGVIENMSYFICPHCGARTDIFDHGGAKKFANETGLDFLGEIPIDVEVREGGDKGKPIVVSNPTSPVAQAFEDVARSIIEKLKS
ncbi:Mrp/NBP35 family ATP-binding protein [Hippea sp. KM1]|uniref:Mrp/NBP35 family ATP-binding protein n=1 Tax=Hippea sp. KM1 TaxID=944481 RepID=UPI0004B7258D|nr:Mrp/NBP35 family ATP-binding protein [Hippea sp. KM1]